MANSEKNTQVSQNLVYLKEVKGLIEDKKLDELYKSAKALKERLNKIGKRIEEQKKSSPKSLSLDEGVAEQKNVSVNTQKVSSDAKVEVKASFEESKTIQTANANTNKYKKEFQSFDRQPFNRQSNDKFKENNRSNYASKNANNSNYQNRKFEDNRDFRRNQNSGNNYSQNRKEFSKDKKNFATNRQDYNKKPLNKPLNDFKKSAQNAPMQVNIEKDNHRFANKPKSNNNVKHYEDGKQLNRKKMANAMMDYDEDRQYIRKLKVKKEKSSPVVVSAPITKAVLTSDHITVKDLSEKIGKTVADIIKKLFILGNMATINSTIDFDTAELVSNDLGVELELRAEKSAEDLFDDYVNNVDDEKDLVRRPPIITVMGHVDHGKTSLLDAIRKTNVVSGEAGGITQHIGAYTIKKDGKLITFIDTPGHAAFTAMRARGAMVTDIAVLVVAADDGIMPQTVEAINHIKAANVPMIVAINKVDKPTAQIERIKQQLAENDVLPEEWGGNAILVPVSAKTGEGIDKLLETMLLVAEIEDLKANPNRSATGVIIEAKLDRGRGPVATVLVQNGTLKIGNTVVCGTCTGKIRAMIDDNGKNVVSVGPSIAVAVLGFDEVPNAGDTVQVVDEKLSKQIIQERKAKEQIKMINKSGGASLEEFMNSNAEVKHLNLIVKADVQGSVEAIKQSLIAIKNDEAKVSIIHSGVGNVTETD
ncbi:MAG: translation initiation factor IF-2, partial [Christensenellales bacterium]